MLAIIDYRAGNVTSVRRALEHLGIKSRITTSTGEIMDSQGVVFPGVGAAGSAMAVLKQQKLDNVLHQVVRRQKPLLGICLGCQIVLEYSQENDTKTLGLIPGTCRRFPPGLREASGEPVRIPHMGWNSVHLTNDCPLFDQVPQEADFYFVHSFYPDPDPEYVLGMTEYGQKFCSVLGRTGLWAVQFHPEKSGRPGLKILENFYHYCREH